jgi:hypothetical protein
MSIGRSPAECSRVPRGRSRHEPGAEVAKLLRGLFDAFQLYVRYDHGARHATEQATLTDDTADRVATRWPGSRQQVRVPNQFVPWQFVPRQFVPPAGFEPAHPPPEGGALSPELRGPGFAGRVAVETVRSIAATDALRVH